MFFLEGKNAYVDSWSCEHVLDARHIIDDVGTKLCVTMQQCIDKNQFVLGSKCITAAECADITNFHAYSAVGVCIKGELYDVSDFL